MTTNKGNNDANCFALSEAVDGAGAGAVSVFGVILGTGCGGGLVYRGQLIDGPHGIGGEWGHNPLPWATADEHPGPRCWCGRRGCMETWVSGPGLAADHARVSGTKLDSEEIAVRARCRRRRRPAQVSIATRAASPAASRRWSTSSTRTSSCWAEGCPSSPHLYEVLPGAMAAHVFAERTHLAIKPPRWGDASGVRGAAWLWNGS